MSHPLPATSVTVSPDGVTSVAHELATLAAELAGDVERIRSAATVLPTALEGQTGWAAGAAATSWAVLCDLISGRAGAVARVLDAAVAAYLAEDAALARTVGRVGGPR